MSAVAVVCLHDDLDAAQRQVVAEGCQQEGLTLVAGTARGPLTVPAGLRVVAVLAGLPAGERAVPPALERLLAGLGQSPALLLVCQEVLVAPCVTLEGGQLRLLGAPLTAELVAAQLRDLRGPGGPAADAAASASAPSIQIRDLRGPGWWAACLWQGRGSAPALVDQEHGFAAALSGAGVERGSTRLFSPGSLTEEQRFAALVERSGEGPAVWFEPRGGSWRFYAPPGGQVWLHSPRRLPPRWRVGAALRPRHRCGAAPDDLVLAWRGGSAEANLDLDLEGGRRALLDQVQQRMERDPTLASAVLVELRP